MDFLKVLNIFLIVFISAEYALSSKQGAKMLDAKAKQDGAEVKRQPEQPNNPIGTPGQEPRLQRRASMMMDTQAETRGESVKRAGTPVQKKRPTEAKESKDYKEVQVEAGGKPQPQGEEKEKEPQQQGEEKEKENSTQGHEDPRKKYRNESRRIFYDAQGICTCGEEADTEYVVKQGAAYNEKDKVLVCAALSRITFGDYVHLSNYKLPENLAQQDYMICMIRNLGNQFFNNDLTAKAWATTVLGVANFVANRLSIDVFKPYLYPGDKEIYKKNDIDVDAFRSKVVEFIKDLVRTHKKGENDYKTLDNLIKPIKTDEVLKNTYNEIVETAIKIRKTRFEYEEETGVKNEIK